MILSLHRYIYFTVDGIGNAISQWICKTHIRKYIFALPVIIAGDFFEDGDHYEQ